MELTLTCMESNHIISYHFGKGSCSRLNTELYHGADGIPVHKIHTGHANMFLSRSSRETLAGVTGATIRTV